MNKYRNVPTVVNGIRFDSKAESKRYQELILLERGKVISDLSRQVRYTLTVNGIKVCTYVADFVYVEAGKQVVEDVKSQATITPVYRIKKKLMLACHGIEIRETLK